MRKLDIFFLSVCDIHCGTIRFLDNSTVMPPLPSQLNPGHSYSFFRLKGHELVRQYSVQMKTVRLGGFQDGSARFQTINLSNPAPLHGRRR